MSNELPEIAMLSFFGLAKKFKTLVVLAMTISITLIVLASTYFYTQKATEELTYHGRSILNILSEISEEHLNQNNLTGLEHAVNTISSDKKITHIAFYDHEGDLLFHNDAEADDHSEQGSFEEHEEHDNPVEKETHAEQGSEHEHGDIHSELLNEVINAKAFTEGHAHHIGSKERIKEMGQPIFDNFKAGNLSEDHADEPVLGYVVIGMNMHVTSENTKQFLKYLAPLSLLLVLLSALVFSILVRRITAPLAQLSVAAESVGDGDLVSITDPQTNDEVSTLTASFNKMVEQLRKSRLKEKNHQKILEASVLKRTQELNLAVIESQKLADKADKASRAKSEFLATMSHEIRTPMNGVLGMNELLLGTKLSKQQRDISETVRRSGENLLVIINDILDFSKIEAGRLVLDDSNFDLRELVEDSADSFAARAAQKGLELTCFIPQDMPALVTSDSTRFRQVLSNLIGNAIKFTESGEVYVGLKILEQSDEQVRIKFEIRDSGIGMNDDEIARVFESFTQADSSTTRNYGGTGLGLTISQRLVALMGGQLEVHSASGEGSVFTFDIVLPLAEVGQIDKSPLLVGDLANMRVLVVDDNHTNLEIVAYHLDAWHVQHQCVASGAEALAVLRAAVVENTPFTQAILDYHMPEMDGIELTKRIKADDALQSIRVSMFSSVDVIDEEENFSSFGIENSVKKPVRQAELYSVICARQEPNYVIKTNNSSTAEINPGTENMSILVVEDNPVNQAVAVGMLESLGYENIDTAENGLEAVNMLKAQSFDLVLMDILMPVMDGYEAIEKIRQNEERQNVKPSAKQAIIAITANAMHGDRDRCMKAGADEYLSKPFTPTELTDAISPWFDRGSKAA